MAKGNNILIACEVFRPELEHLNAKMAKPLDFIFLKQGLHDTPGALLEELQKTVEKIEEEVAPNYIILGYGFCGRGIYGLKTKKAVLVLPKVHDCIPVLLGDGPDKAIRAEEYAKTYWLSAGWLKYCEIENVQTRKDRYKKYVELYGQDSADYLFETEQSWQSNYKEMCLILWDGLENEQLYKDAEFVATDRNLPLVTRKGSSWYLQELMDGGLDKEKFFHIEPGFTLDINSDGLLEVRVLTSEEK